jgi:hypothetical protein
MKVLVLYRPNSEHGRVVEEFVRDLQRRVTSAATLEVMNVDSREGSATASLYDVMQYPAVLVLQTDGVLHKFWQGTAEVPPLLDEVAGYARA